MPTDTLFTPLVFRSLTVKNRIFRSNISGRFDNYDGSGNQARINWETKFAAGRRRRDRLVVRAGAPARPHRAELRDDRQRRAHPVLARRSARPSTRTTAGSSCSSVTAAGSATSRASSIRDGLSSTDKADPHARLPVRAMTIAQIKEVVARVRRGRPPRARGRARRRRTARRQRLPDHAVPELGDQRPRRTSTAAALENRARFVLDIVRAIRARGRQRLPPADEDQRRGSQRRAGAVQARAVGEHAGGIASRCASGWKQAGVDAIHVSIGSFFPHPMNPAGVDLPVDELAKTYDSLISSGERTFLQLPAVPWRQRARSRGGRGTRRAGDATRSRAANLPDCAGHQAAVSVPVICTGGFQTASVIRAGHRARRLRRGEHRAAADRQQRPGPAVRRRRGPAAPSPCTLLQQVPRQRRREPARLLRRDAIRVARGDDARRSWRCSTRRRSGEGG